MMMVLITACALPWGQPPSEGPLDDPVLQAMVAELDRNINELRLPGAPAPYFIEHAILDVISLRVIGEFGAVSQNERDHYRFGRTHVRVGDYDLDNSNFGRGGGLGPVGGVPLPVEDDVHAIRRALWWATDRQYKLAIEELEHKRAFMNSRVIGERPADFSRETPIVRVAPRGTLDASEADLVALATALSAVYCSIPEVQLAVVELNASGGHRYLVNSEGTRVRTFTQRTGLFVEVTIQADDGMPLTDSIQHYVRAPADFPPVADLQRRCTERAEGLVALAHGPRADTSYTGPVLVRGSAAGALVWGQFGGELDGGQRPLGARTAPDELVHDLNKRILPRSFGMIDDPSRTTAYDTFALGHYVIDDQGVAPQAVTVVEKGRLIQLLMARTPSTHAGHSTGHGRGYGYPTATMGVLELQSSAALSPDDLSARLLDEVEDQDLEFGVRIESFDARNPGWILRAVKVFPDGREEAVRGFELGPLDGRAFKRILAAGNDPAVLNGGSRVGSTLICPSLLFEEVDLLPVDRDFSSPPRIPGPFDRARQPSSDG